MKVFKWILAFIGFLVGGGFGGVLGYVLGLWLDSRVKDEYKEEGRTKGDFTISLLMLIAAIMKADNRVNKSELNYVKQFLVQQYGEEHAKRLVLILRDLLEKDIHTRQVCQNIRFKLNLSGRLQLMYFLIEIAKADHSFSQAEIALLRNIANDLGLRIEDFESLRAMQEKSTNYAYEVLQVDPSASNDEIKQSYRKLVRKYHPDKLAQFGESIQQSAKEKFQEINNAYDQIKKERNFS